MLLRVWPGLDFWYFLRMISSPSWVFTFLAMDFIKKTTGLVSIFLISTLIISWLASNLLFSKFYFSLKRPGTNRLFRGYECEGKAIGYMLVVFGNIGLYYFSEKSVACMLTFLFLAFYCLCAIFCIQPYTSFGALEFLLSASLNQALSLCRLHSSYFWLDISVCIVIAGIRHFLEPKHPHEEATINDSDIELGQIHPRTNEDDPPPLEEARLDNNPSTSGSSFDLAQSESTNPLLEGDSTGPRNIQPRRRLAKKKLPDPFIRRLERLDSF